jgi:hypothetical protein
MALPRAILRLRPRHPGGGLHRQVERLADPGERARLLVDEILELVGGGREFLRDLLALEVGLDLRPHLVERAHLRGRDAVELDHVPAEFALHGAGDFARFHREHRVVERLDHRAARVAAELSSLRRRARVLRVLPREVGTSPDLPLPARQGLPHAASRLPFRRRSRPA